MPRTRRNRARLTLAALAAAFLAAGVVTSVALVWLPLLYTAYRRTPGMGWTGPLEQVYEVVAPDGRVLIAGVMQTPLSETWRLDADVKPLPPTWTTEPIQAPPLERVQPPPWAEWPADAPGDGRGVTRWGWPLRCLVSREARTVRAIPGGRNTRAVHEDVWTVRWRAGQSFAFLPTGVLRTAMAANAALFGAAFAGLALAPFVVRAMWRRRRGRCARCGYDLGGRGGGVCPECGAQ
jgi:hypothetical protein